MNRKLKALIDEETTYFRLTYSFTITIPRIAFADVKVAAEIREAGKKVMDKAHKFFYQASLTEQTAIEKYSADLKVELIQDGKVTHDSKQSDIDTETVDKLTQAQHDRLQGPDASEYLRKIVFNL